MSSKNAMGRIDPTRSDRIDLDVKDRKIIGQLYVDPLQSFSSIGKATGLSKESVHYRIRRLEEKKFLLGFRALINEQMLGYNTYFLFVRFRKTGAEAEATVTDYFIAHPLVKTVDVCGGKWDLLVVFCAKDVFQINDLVRGFTERSGDKVDGFRLVTIFNDTFHPLKYLFKDLGIEPPMDQPLLLTRPERVELDEKDRKLLSLFYVNPRASWAELAAQSGLSADAVNYRIKKLLRDKVIRQVLPVFNLSMLGRSWHIITAMLDQPTLEQEKRFVAFLQKHPNVVCINKILDDWAINFDVHVETNYELHQIVREVREKFSGILKSVESFPVFADHKFEYHPVYLMD